MGRPEKQRTRGAPHSPANPPRSVCDLGLVAVAAMLCACLAACGSGAALQPSAKITAAAVEHSDADGDSPGQGYYDADDSDVLDYGAPASATDRQAIALAIKRFSAAAAAGDGAAVCTMIYSLFAESIIENVGAQSGAHLSQSKRCEIAVSIVLEQTYRRLAAEDAGLKVVGVRVLGDRAFALLSTGTRPERYILLRRESGTWKLNGLADRGMP